MINSEIVNCTFFMIPVRIKDSNKLSHYLNKGENWTRKEKAFDVNYILSYARDILTDERIVTL